MFGLPAMSQAGEPFEGTWAKSGKECRDQDAPTSRTLIDLANKIDGKPSPIFDQYENHRKITQVTRVSPAAATLTATFFEFWEEFKRAQVATNDSSSFPSREAIAFMVQGATYVRCKPDRK